MSPDNLFEWLMGVNTPPKPFSQYTTIELWSDKHISEHMLAAHLDRTSNLASRNMDFIRRSSDWMKCYFHIAASTRVLDFGCGPGLYATEWARMGADVTGIDASTRSIEYATRSAKEANLPITYISGNYLEHSFVKRHDLVTMIFCDYCALSASQRHQLHAQWKAVLSTKGRILFDVHSINHFNSVHEERSFGYYPNGFWSAEPYYLFQNVYRYDSEHVLLEKFTIVEENRTRTFYNWLQCFSKDSLWAELERAGFVVDETFASVSGDPFTDDAREIAVVVRNAT